MQIIFISEKIFTLLRVFSHLVPLMAKVTSKGWNQLRKKQLFLSLADQTTKWSQSSFH